MEKTEKDQAHDFMSVNSFSQLPFIRPAPVREKPIRLFGIDFAGSEKPSSDNTSTTTSSSDPDSAADANAREGSKDGDTGRRFECHYCCRNFPTSQALGGHQNAHKRERQHAKRAHLQSALAHNSIYDSSHVYGLLNYRLSTSPHSSLHASRGLEPAPLYSSDWSGRLYGRHVGPSRQPIDGNPLPGLWRIPVVQSAGLLQQDRSLQLLSGAEGGPLQSRRVYESAASSGQDPVCLDLHL